MNLSCVPRINRYIMECKLISFLVIFPGSPELIDTLWNVNTDDSVAIKANKRINRYIMECKYCFREIFQVGPMRINRYIMECKYAHPCFLVLFEAELIDTLWNVNSISMSLNFWISGINRYIMECKCYPAGHF